MTEIKTDGASSAGDGVSRGTLPQTILTFATMMRANFGQGVALKFAADERTGQAWGNAAWDDPGNLHRQPPAAITTA
jgi:hypothetical protein